MTPFQQLRIWLRRAGAAERATTVIAMAVVVALFGWLVAPLHSGSRASTLTSSGFDSSAPSLGSSPANPAGVGTIGPGSTNGSVLGDTSRTTRAGITGVGSTGFTGSTAAGTAGNGSTGTAGNGKAGATGNGSKGAQSQCRPATAGQGVTASTINVAVTIVNLVGAAGNEAVGVPDTDEQQRDWQQVADSINTSGGVGCRALALKFYLVNPLNTNEAQQKCLEIAADNPFLALDVGALTNVGAGDCIPAQKIPLIGQLVSKDQGSKYYPYYLNPIGLAEVNYHSGYLGAQQKGYFSAASGFKKLGIIYQSCRPTVVAAGRTEVRNAGIPDSATTTYDMGCPPGRQNSPADLQQAVLAFKNAGVTHVTAIDDNNRTAFTKTAGQQGFTPHYVFAEDVAAGDTSGPLAPDPDNFDGALNVIGRRLGEQGTPGYKPSAGTDRCNAIYAKTGQKPVYQQGAGFGGVVCDLLWFTSATIANSPTLERSSLVGGMHAIGVLDYSFPWGPVDFSVFPAGTPYGLESWRVVRWSKSCTCWQVLDSTFHAPFA